MRKKDGKHPEHFKDEVEHTRYGKLSIDNNAAERKLLPVAMRRKNHLFPGLAATLKLGSLKVESGETVARIC